MNNSQDASSIPWYESNLLWGPTGIGLGIISTVIASVKHDLRWLLVVAWLLFVLTAWHLFRNKKHTKKMTIIASIVAAIALLGLNRWLGPPSSGDTISTSQPTRQEAAVGSSGTPNPPAARPPILAPQLASPTHPVARTSPKHPIIINSIITSSETPIAGSKLFVRVNLQNTSGETISNTAAVNLISLQPVFPNGADNLPIQEDLWRHLSDQVAKSPPGDVPSAGGGLFNQEMQTPPLPQNVVDEILDGTHSFYFLMVVQDIKTRKNLVEVCGYISGPNTFHECLHHNKP